VRFTLDSEGKNYTTFGETATLVTDHVSHVI